MTEACRRSFRRLRGGFPAALGQDIAHPAETLSKLVQHQTTDRVHTASSEIEASIRRNPLTAVSVAFGIGIAVGMINWSRG